LRRSGLPRGRRKPILERWSTSGRWTSEEGRLCTVSYLFVHLFIFREHGPALFGLHSFLLSYVLPPLIPSSLITVCTVHALHILHSEHAWKSCNPDKVLF
jgi:hypothetical protein